ncbi:glycerophosphodiester phosphodiesterase family protein [Tropicimonas sp. S265A]|uniref:glycerophosphodiester phosphodiesterase family protein n=1 Tax=Tropicimonas sp. S265A TaxID=3415134 RepID=UPI003C7B7669
MKPASAVASHVPLPLEFLGVPLAHRGLHDQARNVIENSLGAVRAAVDAGYGIELDVQPTRDGDAVVFHDPLLDRLTSERGAVADRTTSELTRLALLGGDGDRIPTLSQVLADVAGRVPVLIELKDQSGCFGPEPDPLARAVARALRGYTEPTAVMSFNPHSVAHLARLSPQTPRGLTTKRFLPRGGLTYRMAARLNRFELFEEVGASFISHDRRSLSAHAVVALRNKGVPILTWTIKSPRQERVARRVAHNITFEGYTPSPRPASGGPIT